MSKICKKRAHGNEKMNLPCAFKKCPGSLHFTPLVCKDAVSIPDISMTYVLNKSLEKYKGLELYSPGGIYNIFITYVEVCKKNFSTAVLMVP